MLNLDTLPISRFLTFESRSWTLFRDEFCFGLVQFVLLVTDIMAGGSLRTRSYIKRSRLIYHSKSGLKCPVFKWQISLDRFIYIYKIVLTYKTVQTNGTIRKPDAIRNPNKVDHSKSGHVRFSDPHCTDIFLSDNKMVSVLLREQLFNLFTKKLYAKRLLT